VTFFLKNFHKRSIILRFGLYISVEESYKPIFLRNKRSGQIAKEIYIRMNASTHQITDIEEIVEYVFNKKWKNPTR